ncbi:MAG: hypothetical protein K2Q18_18130 [Bdellovibrionales bacterium]|nr:hypothetical protein [Bdellovibrionales bacterium]
MKKAMIFLLLLAVAPSAFAKNSIALSPISFRVSADNVLAKFEQSALYPEGVLRRFRPVGAKFSNKQVSLNTISFIATKTILFVSKSVHVNGVLDSIADNRSCSQQDVGYVLNMHFEGSDALVTNNVEGLEAIICLRPMSDTELIAAVRSRIIIGNNYSSILGPMAVDLIKEQVTPLLNALTEELKSLK